jgi:hypothetical protein
MQKAPVEGQVDSPKSILLQPVFDGFEVGKVHRVVGVLMAVISWVDFFTDVRVGKHNRTMYWRLAAAAHW